MGACSSKSDSTIKAPSTTGTTNTELARNHRQRSSSLTKIHTGISTSNRKEDPKRWFSARIRADQPERLYYLLQGLAAQLAERNSNASTSSSLPPRHAWYQHIFEHLEQEPLAAEYRHSMTGATPLHVLCRDILDAEIASKETFSSTVQLLERLLKCNPAALAVHDAAQNIPLHYAIAPSITVSTTPENSNNHDSYNPYGEEKIVTQNDNSPWKKRALVLHRIIQTDPLLARQYLEMNHVVFESANATGGCTPLYRALQVMEDDFDPEAPTVDYIAVLHLACPVNAGKGNASDGDKPLSLLYRRFTRQFDISEQFFAGDNSRPQVVQHRQKYKTAAGNTWKCVEFLLRPTTLPLNAPWGIVHCAVQVETPPDLLRYIVETNAQDLTRVDPQGNLPLHYAAAARPPSVPGSSLAAMSHYPAFYTKYVMDELLYKFPEAASMADAQGLYPLTLAVMSATSSTKGGRKNNARSGKQWIGGGIKSLYDAYPDALQQIQLDEHPSLKKALSLAEDDGDNDDENHKNSDENKQDSKEDQISLDQEDELKQKLKGVIKDEPHDAIMLVQQPSATVEEITTSMWAHEEDAGVQMLGCVAISKMLEGYSSPVQVLRIALSATASVVNAMKAHPNELIVQEKACLAIQKLALADGYREVSMVASGAVAAVVGAMQAHVGDAGVQEQACLAIAAIVQQPTGGADRATVVASVSGMTAILNALAAHAHQLGVQMGGLKALDAMTKVQDNANLPELPRVQAEPLLMVARDNFPKECTEMVTELLGRMAS